MRIDHIRTTDWTQVDPSRLQRLARRLLTWPGRWLYRYRSYGYEPRVPTTGGFIVAPAPHGAYADPFVVLLGQPRVRLRFMTKYRAFEWFLTGRLVKWCGGFPVHRGGNRSAAALDVAKAVVDSGDGVVIFMEGHLVLDGEGLGTPRAGAARLALATGAPVVPIALHGLKRARAYGSSWWRHWPRVTAIWGAPLVFERDASPTEDRVNAVRDEIWAEITRLHTFACELAATPGGRPDTWALPGRSE